MIEAHIIEPIIELVRTSTYPVLKNDGVMALTLIFSDPDSKSILDKALPSIIADAPVIDISEPSVNEDEPQQAPPKPELRSFLQVLVDDICLEKSELPVQIKCNMCVLLLKVIEAARSGKSWDISYQLLYITNISNSTRSRRCHHYYQVVCFRQT